MKSFGFLFEKKSSTQFKASVSKLYVTLHSSAYDKFINANLIIAEMTE